ncbi:MAG: PHP domain-containing protein [Oscillospiraceae bacterium]|jgi:predicted metal-dependent phosphoesterase TrpH|nr:PHP domain-containing protein [Oscillospiraceae bacterium]
MAEPLCLLEAHAHTAEVSPCGKLPAAAVVAALAARGYGAVVITDHYFPRQRENQRAREAFLAGIQAARAAAPAGFAVLPGLEMRFAQGLEDFLVYGMDEADIVALPDDVCERGLAAFHALAADRGWLVYQAHPFRPKLARANPADLDGVETFNGNPRHDSRNRLAAAFAEQHALRTIAGSDIHQAGDVGAVGLLVPEGATRSAAAFAGYLRGTPRPTVEYEQEQVSTLRFRTGALPGRRILLEASWSLDEDKMTILLSNLRAAPCVATAWDDTLPIGLSWIDGDGVCEALVLPGYQSMGVEAALGRLAKGIK